jgi:hypothetical protein
VSAASYPRGRARGSFAEAALGSSSRQRRRGWQAGAEEEGAAAAGSGGATGVDPFLEDSGGDADLDEVATTDVGADCGPDTNQ